MLLDLPYDDVAEILGVRPAAVRQALSRALCRVRRSLGVPDCPSCG